MTHEEKKWFLNKIIMDKGNCGHYNRDKKSWCQRLCPIRIKSISIHKPHDCLIPDALCIAKQLLIDIAIDEELKDDR